MVFDVSLRFEEVSLYIVNHFLDGLFLPGVFQFLVQYFLFFLLLQYVEVEPVKGVPIFSTVLLNLI